MVNYLILFLIGSVLGFVFEFLMNKIKKPKSKKPGFFIGTYLPVYGFGIAFMFLVCTFQINVYLKIIIISFSITIIEYIAGLIFNKGNKLWDYSNNFGNIGGHICPVVTLVWTLFTCVFVLLIFPWLKDAIKVLHNPFVYVILGTFYSAITLDIIYNIYKAIKKKRN